jgi:hypothetical protein
MSAAGAVGADQHVLARPTTVGVAGQLSECGPEHRDVVDDGVGAGVARPQSERQRLPGPLRPVVEEGPQGESAWGAVSALLPVRFPRPLTEPAVRLSTQRALHGRCRQAWRGAGVQGVGIAPR